MKKVIVLISIMSFLVCSNQRMGLIKNFIIPGSGIPETEQYSKTKRNYLIREAFIWGALFSSRQNSDVYEDNYINYGIDYSGANVADFNYQYAINVGDYNTMSDYNNAMLGRRIPDKVYPNDEGYEWNWESNSNRLKYRDMLRTSRNLDKLGDFAIAGLLIHRIVGIINYTYLMNNNKSLGLSSNIYKTDLETVQLEFKFNL